jgi:hypothetical protein
MDKSQPKIESIKPGEVFSLKLCTEKSCQSPGPKLCAFCNAFKSCRFTVLEIGEFVVDGMVRIGAKVMYDPSEVRVISWTCLERAKKGN